MSRPIASVLSIVLAWATVHTVYALRYAQLYYHRAAGGVDFNDTSAPCYPDFAYLALTIGMTFQVSDTDLTTTTFRRLAIRHALLSYAFGALIIAVTINLIAGLGHRRGSAAGNRPAGPGSAVDEQAVDRSEERP